MVAVGSARPDEELEVDLGRDTHRHGAGHEGGRGHGLTLARPGGVLRAPSDAPRRPALSGTGVRTRSRPRRSGRRPRRRAARPRVRGSMPAATQGHLRRRGRARPAREGRRAASCGAGRRRRRRRGRRPRAWPSSPAASRRVSATRPESTLGTGQKTLRGTVPGEPDVGVPGGLDARHAVGARAGRGGEPLGDLELDHDEHRPQRREALEHPQDHRHRDVVREVGHERGRRRAGQRR